MPPSDDDHHNAGLAHDLRTLTARRRALIGLGAVGAGAAIAYVTLGGLPGQAEPIVSGTASDGSTCVKNPIETAGPFPGDGTNSRNGQSVNVLTQTGIVRQDIRPSFNGMTRVADGVPLTMNLLLVDAGQGCAPLVGYAVYVWQCDATGRYSLYDTNDSNYLRGVQVSDSAGRLSFVTIVPGCYAGRWPHMHFEVFASEAAAALGDDPILTSQFAYPAATMAPLYLIDPRYAASAANLEAVSLDGDVVFRDNTPEQVMAQTLQLTRNVVKGLQASATVGLVT